MKRLLIAGVAAAITLIPLALPTHVHSTRDSLEF